MGEPAPASGERWSPNLGPQTSFLASSAYEVLYGGAAGGGKSEGLLVGPLRFVHLPRFRGILFRRTFPELEKSLIQRSFQYYQPAFPGARYNEQKHVWKFLSGALIYFSHLEHDKSVFDHQSAEYQYIGFDELTSFTRWQYTYMLSRARSSSGIPIRIRSGTNPGGEGHSWVQKRWAPWLGPPEEEADTYDGPRAEPGRVLHYVNEAEGERWVSRGTLRALSRVFIPAKLADNPHIDSGYADRLMGLDAVTRARLKDGNWLIRPARGLYFKRGWLRFVDVVPAGARRFRYWDLAATEEGGGEDPDWTVGVLLAIYEGQIFIESVIRFRGTPREVEATILATAEVDGVGVHIGLPQDPGQAGKFQASYLIGKLQGYVVHAAPETGDKVTRAGPISAQAEAGNVALVRGRWNAQCVGELESFPEGKHDDVVDALSGAYARLVGSPAPTYGGQSPVQGKWGGRRRR